MRLLNAVALKQSIALTYHALRPIEEPCNELVTISINSYVLLNDIESLFHSHDVARKQREKLHQVLLLGLRLYHFNIESRHVYERILCMRHGGHWPQPIFSYCACV